MRQRVDVDQLCRSTAGPRSDTLLAFFTTTGPVTVVPNGTHRVMPRSLSHVLVVVDLHVPTPVLRSDESEDDDIGIDGAHEDTDDLAVLVASRLAQRGQGKALPDGGFDGTAGRGYEVAELVGGTHDEGAERAW